MNDMAAALIIFVCAATGDTKNLLRQVHGAVLGHRGRQRVNGAWAAELYYSAPWDALDHFHTLNRPVGIVV